MNSRTRRRPLCILAASAALALAASSTVASAEEWKFTLTPYAWLTDVGVDVAIDDRDVVDAEVAVEDLVEDLDATVQVRFEAQYGANGVWTDLFDVALSQDAETVALPNGAGSATFRPEMGITLLELGGLYDPKGDQEGFQLLYGARILHQRAEIESSFTFPGEPSLDRTYEVDETLVDGLVGFRFLRRIGERWMFSGRADVSTGGTELTWSAGPMVGYSFGEAGRYTLTAGYRKMVVDFETADDVDAKMTLSGPVVGLRLAF
jgi:hypothetical protein